MGEETAFRWLKESAIMKITHSLLVNVSAPLFLQTVGIVYQQCKDDSGKLKMILEVYGATQYDTWCRTHVDTVQELFKVPGYSDVQVRMNSLRHGMTDKGIVPAMHISIDKTTNRAARPQESEASGAAAIRDANAAGPSHAAPSQATTENRQATPALQSSPDSNAAPTTQAGTETLAEAGTQGEVGESSSSGVNAPDDRKGKGREVEGARKDDDPQE
jgi:hypothetical protein